MGLAIVSIFLAIFTHSVQALDVVSGARAEDEVIPLKAELLSTTPE